ncbi:type I-E CRISPR-associated protein Cse2/CasB [Sphaerisporangium viridialbum]|uniref:type I-E CRISPR-associated protein Cse2/CasB n=1 Tax=Sphaerisporangium viridialbum TaxID=46189 RepID=UPI003C77A1BF
MSQIPSIETADKYVDYLRREVNRDPGRRSALRRGLGRPVNDAMVRKSHAVVARWLPTQARPAVESAYYSIAALIAAQPARGQKEPEPEPADPSSIADSEEKPKRIQLTIGNTLGLAVQDKKLNPDTIEARLHLLCRQDIAGLHRQLPGLVRQLAAKEISPDWGRLLCDLSWWEHRRDEVTKRWLQDFYRAMNNTTNDEKSDSEDQ